MKALAITIILCAFFVSGCATRAQINGNSNTTSGAISQPPAGTTATGGSANFRLQSAGGNSIAAALIAIGLLAGAVPPAHRAPELAPDRRVNEQDCTQPIDFSSGNLRCK